MCMTASLMLFLLIRKGSCWQDKVAFRIFNLQGPPPFTPTHHPAFPTCISLSCKHRIRTESSFCPSCNHTADLLQTLLLINPHPSPTCLSPTNQGIKLYSSCTAHRRRLSLPPSHFTSHYPCHGWLWTWKYKCRHWLNFWIPAGF